MEQQQQSEEARKARMQEMPSPAPAPQAAAVVHAEPIDDWTHKPFFTTTVHAGEHEFSLSRNEDDDLVVRVFNTNSGDRFERVVGEAGIEQLLPSDMPAGVKSSDGFAQFLQLALGREAGASSPEAAQIACESREGREGYTVELALVIGAGMFANRYPVNLQIPLKNRATSNDKHLIALRTLSDKFGAQVNAQEEKLMGEIKALQGQLDLMKLQMNQRVFFGVNHSVHIACTKLVMGVPVQEIDRVEKTGGTVDGIQHRDGRGNGQAQAKGVAFKGNCNCSGFCSCGTGHVPCAEFKLKLEDVPSATGVSKALFAADTDFIMPLLSALLTPLQLCRDLTSFEVPKEHGSLITDLSFLRGLPNLEELTLHKPAIRDFDELATLPSLKTLVITDLALEGGGEIDVTPLAAATTLETISFRGSAAIANVAPLAKIVTLQELDVTDTRVTDRRAFSGCEGLAITPE